MADSAFEAPMDQQVPLGNLPQVLNTYRRHLVLILIVAFATFLAVAAFTFLQTPKYTATATVLLAPRQTLNKDNGPIRDPNSDASVDTQVEALKARDLADLVTTRLHLDQDPEFASPEGRDAVVSKVASDLNVRRVGQTYLIEVRYTSKQPKKAALIANAFADGFVERQSQSKSADMQQSNDLMTARLSDLQKQAEAAAREAQEFRVRNGLMDAGATGGGTLAQQDLSDLSQQLILARAQAAEDSARLADAQSQARSGNGGALGATLGSQTIAQLRSQRAEVSRRVADMESRYGDRHPDLVSAKLQLRDYDRQIEDETNRVIGSLRSQARISSERANSLAGALNQSRGEVANASVASVHLSELETRATTARTIYENFLSRVKENAAQQAITQADARVDTRAQEPLNKSSPNVPINLAIGMALGVFLGIATAVVRQGFVTGMNTMEEVERKLNLPYLASIPVLSTAIKRLKTSSPIDAVTVHPLSSYTESFRALGAAIAPPRPEQPIKTIVVTSSLPNEGKTTAAVCMARVAAMAGMKVLLMDCDLRRRAATQALKLKPTAGLLDVLQGHAPLEKALILDHDSGAHVLPLREGAPTTESPFASEVFDRLLTELKERYDLIVIDTAPVLPVVDTRILAPKVDAVALLVRWRVTPLNAVKAAIHMLEGVGGEVTGVALSLVNLKEQSRSGYGDPSYYHKAYSGYYLE
ncbi:GumC family protein [Caulobacter sp. LARHSG274]